MPRKNEPKLTNRKDGRAVVHWNGKMYVMGKVGTPEAQKAYHRFCIELQSNPKGYVLPKEADGVTIQELCAGYVESIEGTAHPANFSHCKTVISDFLLPIYGDVLSESGDNRPAEEGKSHQRTVEKMTACPVFVRSGVFGKSVLP